MNKNRKAKINHKMNMNCKWSLILKPYILREKINYVICLI